MIDSFMTTQELCDLYHIHQRTVYRWQAQGKLNGHKVGRRLLFNPLEVASLIGQGEQTGRQVADMPLSEAIELSKTLGITLDELAEKMNVRGQ